MKLLLAYDGLAPSRPALEEAAREAREEGYEVTVLSVVPPDARPSKSGGHMGLPPHAEEDLAEAGAYLEQHGVVPQTRVAWGKPAEEILGEARRGYDLIVLGTRELGTLSQLLLGSVGRKVTKDAPCPVTVAGASGTRSFEPLAAVR